MLVLKEDTFDWYTARMTAMTILKDQFLKSGQTEISLLYHLYKIIAEPDETTQYKGYQQNAHFDPTP